MVIRKRNTSGLAGEFGARRRPRSAWVRMRSLNLPQGRREQIWPKPRWAARRAMPEVRGRSLNWARAVRPCPGVQGAFLANPETAWKYQSGRQRGDVQQIRPTGPIG